MALVAPLYLLPGMAPLCAITFPEALCAMHLEKWAGHTPQYHHPHLAPRHSVLHGTMHHEKWTCHIRDPT